MGFTGEHDSLLQPPPVLETKTLDELDIAFLEREYIKEQRLRKSDPKHPALNTHPRAQEPELPLACLGECLYRKQVIHSDGTTNVELRNGTVLRVNAIIRNTETGHINLRGWRFCRRNAVGPGDLDKHRPNEVFLKLEVDLEDDRPATVQGQVDVRLSSIRRIVDLVLTNQPHHRLAIAHGHMLFCRFKILLIADTAHLRVKGRYAERAFMLLRQDECDQSFGESEKRLGSRRCTEEFGLGYGKTETIETKPRLPPDEFWVKTAGSASLQARDPGLYTFGDGFCGAGGVTTGARLAGLIPSFAFDHNPHMCSTYHANFPQVKIAQAEATDIAEHKCYHARVDVLHLSPPCQPWSRAHGFEGVNSEKNREALFKTSALIRSIQPRICTIEQTSSLEDRYQEALLKLVEQFTHIGWSVRYRKQRMQNFGCPQKRDRLIMIACAPGEKLPTFPPETHSECGMNGLKPWSCVGDWLNGIPSNAPHHDLLDPFLRLRKAAAPYSVLEALDTIICRGSKLAHPSGKRHFTVRELARLQTLPMDFKLPHKKTVSKEQIGNMVPPIYTEKLFRHIVQQLKQADGGSLRSLATINSQHSSKQSTDSRTANATQAKSGIESAAEDTLNNELRTKKEPFCFDRATRQTKEHCNIEGQRVSPIPQLSPKSILKERWRLRSSVSLSPTMTGSRKSSDCLSPSRLQRKDDHDQAIERIRNSSIDDGIKEKLISLEEARAEPSPNTMRLRRASHQQKLDMIDHGPIMQSDEETADAVSQAAREPSGSSLGNSRKRSRAEMEKISRADQKRAARLERLERQLDIDMKNGPDEPADVFQPRPATVPQPPRRKQAVPAAKKTPQVTGEGTKLNGKTARGRRLKTTRVTKQKRPSTKAKNPTSLNHIFKELELNMSGIPEGSGPRSTNGRQPDRQLQNGKERSKTPPVESADESDAAESESLEASDIPIRSGTKANNRSSNTSADPQTQRQQAKNKSALSILIRQLKVDMDGVVRAQENLHRNLLETLEILVLESNHRS